MRSLVIFVSVIAALSALSDARHVPCKRDVIEAIKGDVKPATIPDFKEHNKEQIEQKLLPKPDPKENIEELDQHTVLNNKEGSKEHKEKHNHSKEKEKKNHNTEDKPHSKEDSNSIRNESNDLYGDELITIVAIFINPESHRPRIIARKMPQGYGQKLLL